MLSKKQEKLVRSLGQKKFREETGLFVAEGKKLFEEAITAGQKPKWVYASPHFLERHPLHQEYELISEQEMAKISNFKSPPGLLAVFAKQTLLFKKQDLLLVLDELRDPGNLGTILRTAEGFGVDGVICSEQCAELYNPKVVQASMGSVFRMPVQYLDIEEFLQEHQKSHQILGASLTGSNVYQKDIQKPCILIMGSESHGMRPAVEALISEAILIPQKGKLESMNVSIATAILLAEIARRFQQ